MNGTLFFKIGPGIGLWRSDGTEAETVLVHDINPGPASSGLGDLKEMNGAVYFRGQNNLYDSELWVVEVIMGR